MKYNWQLSLKIRYINYAEVEFKVSIGVDPVVFYVVPPKDYYHLLDQLHLGLGSTGDKD
jgi:hypothetical protein